MIRTFWGWLSKISIIQQIVIAIVLGVVIALIFPTTASYLGFLGTLFIKALKSVAPVLVFVLILAAIAKFDSRGTKAIRPVLWLYFISMLAATLTAVTLSLIFPTNLMFAVDHLVIEAPQSVNEVFEPVLNNLIDNPIHAIAEANFIGILPWAVGLGIALRQAADSTKAVVQDMADAVSKVIQVVIRFAPVGIFGLVVVAVTELGAVSLYSYLHLLVVLIGAMLFIALVINPLIVAVVIRENPYPLVFRCLKDSGITAFFMRSSVANIPVNLRLAERLGVEKTTYSLSIPLGAMINMSGAAVTITVLTLAAVHTLGIQVDVVSMSILMVIVVLCSCGASGVPGGSLLLIPLACSLFGVDLDTAMQVVAIGLMLSVLQDSAETATNSSSDVIFTAAVDMAQKKKAQKS